MTDNGGKSGESRNATRSVPVERIKHSDAIALTRPLLLGKPSKTIPPLRLISLLLLSFFFHFLISIDDVKYGYQPLKTYNDKYYSTIRIIKGERMERFRLLKNNPTRASTAMETEWSHTVSIGDAGIRVFFSPEPGRLRNFR